MARTVTSAKRKKSSRAVLKKYDVFGAHLKDPKLVKEVLVDALMANDMETFQDVLVAYLRTVSKSELAGKTKLGRQTLYDLINEEKEFNPTLSTLGSILEALAA
jgi:DNA-binding phage protein